MVNDKNISWWSTDKALKDFWFSKTRIPLPAYGWNGDCRAIVETLNGEICSALLLIPFVKDGVRLGHHLHIASDWHNKKLIGFMERAREMIAVSRNIEWVSVETQNSPSMKSSEKLAQYMGMWEIDSGYGWKDYVWNSNAESNQERRAA